MPKKVNPEEYTKVVRILMGNSEKSFVKRILQPDAYPVIENEDGTKSTHKMAYAEKDGKFVVYPTILYDGKKLTEYAPDEALNQASKTGNMIEFDTEEEANWFSQQYKQVWEKE